MSEAFCPQCHKKLIRILQPSNSPLNYDQWASQLAGKFYCETCPDNGRGSTGLCYWWESETVEVAEGGRP